MRSVQIVTEDYIKAPRLVKYININILLIFLVHIIFKVSNMNYSLSTRGIVMKLITNRIDKDAHLLH